jgi:beta-galactosidase
MGAYPWLTAWTGDIDITGHRRPISYYREIVFGLRHESFIAVQPPRHHGDTPTHRSPWSATHAISSWSWDGFEGKPITVEVYADADEVELVVNGATVGSAPAGEPHRFRAQLETAYEPGVIEAVSYRDGVESGRTALRSATGPVRLDVRADRQAIRADDTDLAFVEITLVDPHGTLCNLADRPVTVSVAGPAVLQGLGSANPRTEETFASSTHDTFGGRALAVVRPTGAGTISVSVNAHGCPPATVEIQAS